MSVGVEEHENEVFQANGAASGLGGVEDHRYFGSVRNLKRLVVRELRRGFFEASDVARLGRGLRRFVCSC